MSLKSQWIINILMILFSWLSLPFFGWRKLKRFLPASILIVIFEVLNALVGKKRKWWIFYNKPNSFVTGELPFSMGPFFVTALWILKWSYGNFKKFLLYNAMLHAFFAFIVIKVLKKLKVAKLVRINECQFFLYFFYKAFLLYALQYMFEGKKKWI